MLKSMLISASVTIAIGSFWTIVRRRHAYDRRRHAGRWMRHSSVFAGIGALSILVFGGGAVASHFSPIAATAILAACCVPGSVLLTEYALVRHELTNEGMSYASILAPRRYFRWDDVACVRLVPSTSSISLELPSGETVRVSTLLVGFDHFARLVLTAATRAEIDVAVRRRLEASARDR